MKTFRVWLQRTVYQQALVTIEAQDEDEARRKAMIVSAPWSNQKDYEEKTVHSVVEVERYDEVQ